MTYSSFHRACFGVDPTPEQVLWGDELLGTDIVSLKRPEDPQQALDQCQTIVVAALWRARQKQSFTVVVPQPKEFLGVFRAVLKAFLQLRPGVSGVQESLKVAMDYVQITGDPGRMTRQGVRLD